MSDAVDDLKARMAVAALDALARSAEDLLGRATRLAPVDEGTLRGSGAVTLIVNGARFEGQGARRTAEAAIRGVVKSGRKVLIQAEVSFSTVYARRQHEELTWNHPKGGQAKYLEQPHREQAARYERILALAVDAALAGVDVTGLQGARPRRAGGTDGADIPF